MTHTCAYGPGCWVTASLIVIAWWLIASALLWMTWNKIIVAMTKAKAAKYPQALLLLATISFVICLPKWYSKRHHGYGGRCCDHSDCRHEHGGMKGADNDDDDKDCPYAHSKKTAGESAEGAKKK